MHKLSIENREASPIDRRSRPPQHLPLASALQRMNPCSLTRKNKGFCLLGFILLFALGTIIVIGAKGNLHAADNSCKSPPFISSSVPPMVMLVMSKDHTAFFPAYSDTIDVDKDGVLDTTYKPSITYEGYFDALKCYDYDSANNYFNPSGAANATTHYCEGSMAAKWSGNFLNWATMSRIDVLRKVLHGGYRSTDGGAGGITVLERSFIPDEGHSWVKVYDGDDLGNLTPYSKAALDGAISIYNVTRFGNATTLMKQANLSAGTPMIRVAKGCQGGTCGNAGVERGWANWDSAETTQGYYYDEIVDNDNPRSTNRTAGGDGKGNYAVRVKVCASGLLEDNCKSYSGNYKPTGLLQKYGDNDALHFGLISGSYNKDASAHGGNISGGVLRKKIGSIKNEINSDGTFKATIDGTLKGIIKTIDNFRLQDAPGGGWYTNCTDASGDHCGPFAAMKEGKSGCRNWGNPVGEMIYESLRYFSGAMTPTPDYDADDSALGFNGKVTWDDPYASHPYCSKPYILVLSDLLPSYDDDQLPGSAFKIYGTTNNFTGSLSAPDILTGTSKSLNVKDLADFIGTHESLPSSTFIGESSGSNDQLCTAKGNYTLGTIRGMCPGYSGVRGSFYSAAVTYFGRTSNLNTTVQGTHTPSTFVVALSDPLPTITLKVGANKDKIISISPVSKGILAGNPSTNCSYRKARIISQNQVAGTGELEVVWEDSYQASDFDKDWTQRIKWTISGDSATIETRLYKKTSGAGTQFGYVVSGSTADGLYMDIKAGQGENTTTPPTAACATADCVCYVNGFGSATCDGNVASTKAVYSKRTFTSGTSAAKYLKSPLWYAAKWGGFTDLNGNNMPDSRLEWTSKTDTTLYPDPDPDNYFFVANPNELFQSLDKAFGQILQREGSAGAVATVTQEVHQGDIVVRAAFEAYEETNPSLYTWQGHLETYRPFDGCGTFNDQTVCQGITGCTWSGGTCSGQMYGFQDPRYSSRFCTQIPNGNCWDGGDKLKAQTHATRNVFTWLTSETPFTLANSGALSSLNNEIDFNGDGNATSTADRNLLIRWVRGEDISGTNTRNRSGWILGDVVYSTPVVIGGPSRAAVPRKVAAQDCVSSTDHQCFYNYLQDEQHRDQIVYVGSNDGMLHAFNLGKWSASANKWIFDAADNATLGADLGKERWAYIPSNLLSELQDLAVTTYGTTAGCRHRYSVDLSPQAWEAKIDHDNDLSTPKEWRTVLLGGEREGGDVYFALDITDPGNANVLWEHSMLKNFPKTTASATYTSNYDHLKTAALSKSIPYMGRLHATANGNPFVAFVGGGIHDFKPTLVDATATTSLKTLPGWYYLYYPTFHALDMDTGTDLWKDTWAALLANSNYLNYFPVDHNATYVLPHALSNVAAFDIFDENGVSITQGASQDGFTDVLYAGDYNGTLCSVIPNPLGNSVAPSCMITRKTKTITGANTNPFRGSRQPITVTPVAALDESGSMRVFFGTGKFSDVSEANNDKTDNATMTFYCLLENIDAPFACGDNMTEIASISTPPFALYEKCRASAGTYRWVKKELISGHNVTHADGDGCFTCMYDFETPGERMIDSALVAGGYVFFTTFVPSTDACVPGGTAYLYVLDYMCRPISHIPIVSGATLRYRDARTGSWSTSQPSEVAAVKVNLGVGMPSRPVMDSKGESLLVQTSDARLIKLGVDLGIKGKSSIKGWTRESD